MDDLLQQGVIAYKAGKRDEARKIFISFIKQNPESERGWGWMYDVSGDDKERTYCLKQMLRINPKNEKANQLLNLLLAPTLASNASISMPPATVRTKTPIPASPESLNSNQSNISIKYVIGGLVLFLFVLVVGIIGFMVLPVLNSEPIVAPTLSDMDYGRQAFALFTSYNVVFDEILNITSHISSYPDYQNLNVKLDEIDRIATQINNLPPAPPNFREVESLMRRMSSETFLFTSAMRASIETEDMSLLQEAFVHQYYIIEVSYGAIIEAFPK